jgi:signal transduction histidine kinase
MSSEQTTFPGAFNGALNAELLAHGFECLGDSLVITCVETDNLFWASSGFTEKLPVIAEGGREKLLEAFPTLGCRLAGAAKGGEQKGTIDSLHTNDNGRLLLFSVDYTRLEATCFLLRFQDLSDKATESQRYLEDREQLFSMSRTLGVSEMATALAHELNQPIGTLSNLLEGMKTRLHGDDELLYAINLAQQQTRFSADVITRIRDYTRKKKPNWQAINLEKLVSDSLALLDWELTRSHIKVSVNFDEVVSKPAVIKGDHLMLQQVIINLVRNAMDSINSNPTGAAELIVNCFYVNEDARVSIQDTGRGFPESQQDQLFVPFSSTKPTGMGIGLNICRSFIELHNGRIWLDPRDGGGCIASISLPTLAGH